MKTMTISPLQQDYVTKTEFNEFRDNVDERFDSVDKSIKGLGADLRAEMKINNDKLRAEFKEDMRINNEHLIATLNKDAERHMGMLLEIFQHDLKAFGEQFDAKLDKKLDEEKFIEYMEFYVHRPARKGRSNK